MNKNYSVSVVIPNYNGVDLLTKNLPPLYAALKAAEIDYEVIVSDDASTDPSIQFLRNEYPEIILLESKVNKGFAPTANAGIFASTKDLIFLMNSDVMLTGNYFSFQFKYFTKEDTFGVMGKIIGMDNDVIQDAAKRQYSSGLKIGSDVNIVPTEKTEKWVPTLYLSGANALMDRKKLLLLQGFEAAYAPFYGEDLDLCFRAWKVGWRCYYENECVCRHPNSVTINRYNKRKKIKMIVYRNRFIMHAIHLSGWRKVGWYGWLMVQLFGKSIFLQTEFLKGFFAFLAKGEEIKIAKYKLQQLSKITGITHTNEVVYSSINLALKDIPHCYV